jgi:hypothetical protein
LDSTARDKAASWVHPAAWVHPEDRKQPADDRFHPPLGGSKRQRGAPETGVCGRLLEDERVGRFFAALRHRPAAIHW